MMFAYRLAKDLGQTVEYIWTTMSVLEFQGWVEFYNLEHEAHKKALRKR